MLNLQDFFQALGFTVTAVGGREIKEKDFYQEIRLYRRQKKTIGIGKKINIANVIFDLGRVKWLTQQERELLGSACLVFVYNKDYIEDVLPVSYYLSRRFQQKVAVYDDHYRLVATFHPFINP